MEALLVIDVQPGFGWTDQLSDVESREQRLVGRNIVGALSRYRALDKKVIFVVLPGLENPIPAGQNILEPWLICNSGIYDAKLPKFLCHKHSPFESVFVKFWANAFENLELAPHLHCDGVTDLYLAGCCTSACVMSTAVGAVQNGFNVFLMADCSYPMFADKQEQTEWLDEVTATVPKQHQEKLRIGII